MPIFTPLGIPYPRAGISALADLTTSSLFFRHCRRRIEEWFPLYSNLYVWVLPLTSCFCCGFFPAVYFQDDTPNLSPWLIDYRPNTPEMTRT